MPVRGARERAVLATLVLAAGGLVPVAVLAEAIWDGQPPQTADKAVRNSISALRRRFADAGYAGLIETGPGGYRLPLAGAYLDSADFGRQVAAGRALAAAGSAKQAAAQMRSALRLWRAPALAGTGGRVLEAAAAGLEEQRLNALEDCVDLELSLGRHQELVSELRALTGQWPLRERLAAQLMLALYRSGRQADALDAYQRLAGRLSDELGLSPSTAVTALHEAIVRQDPTLILPEQAGPRAGSGEPDPVPAPELASGRVPRPRPAQLPPDVPGFAGRSAELAALHALLAAREEGTAGAAVVISAIGGTAGIGKTALAVRFAHQAADRFPDGQLYVNLRGFGPSGPPVAPGDVLRRFLDALGVPSAQAPPDLDALSALYRSLLADRRVLVLLDNAADAAQVRPLLPGCPGCLVLVTSRRQLTGLATVEGARLMTLDVLTEEEAHDLLARRLGEQRLAGQREAAGELARLCARLPLALAIAAARADARPGLPLSELAAGLRQAGGPLDALDTGDPATDLRTVFSWSLHGLPPGTARLFALLGLHPGPSADVYAAAALADSNVEEARRHLAQLASAHLIQPTPGGRYAMHDLLRAFAADLVTAFGAFWPDATAGDGEGQEALKRMLDYYLATAAAAMDRLYPAEAHRRPRIPPAATPMPGLPSTQAAVAWLDAERPCLVAVTRFAAVHQWPGHAIRLSATLFRYLQGGYTNDGLAIHGYARDVARQTADPAGEAQALSNLAVTYWRLGRYAEAADGLEQALVLYERIGDRSGQARVLDNLGVACWAQGDHAAAIRHSERALALFSQAGDRYGESVVLNNLGDDLMRLGRYQEAAAHLWEALALSRQYGDRDGEAVVLDSLGEVELRSGQPREAAEHFRQALAIFAELGYRAGEAWALTNLGTALTSLGQPEQAAIHHRRALALLRAASNRGEEPLALNGLGEAASAAENPADAVRHHSAALSVSLETGDREQQARAHAGLGRARDTLGQPARALGHFQQALTLYTGLGYPEADRIREHLTARKQHRA